MNIWKVKMDIVIDDLHKSKIFYKNEYNNLIDEYNELNKEKYIHEVKFVEYTEFTKALRIIQTIYSGKIKDIYYYFIEDISKLNYKEINNYINKFKSHDEFIKFIDIIYYVFDNGTRLNVYFLRDILTLLYPSLFEKIAENPIITKLSKQNKIDEFFNHFREEYEINNIKE